MLEGAGVAPGTLLDTARKRAASVTRGRFAFSFRFAFPFAFPFASSFPFAFAFALALPFAFRRAIALVVRGAVLARGSRRTSTEEEDQGECGESHPRCYVRARTRRSSVPWRSHAGAAVDRGPCEVSAPRYCEA
jgi:hypothetical protein